LTYEIRTRIRSSLFLYNGKNNSQFRPSFNYCTCFRLFIAVARMDFRLLFVLVIIVISVETSHSIPYILGLNGCCSNGDTCYESKSSKSLHHKLSISSLDSNESISIE
jgi:hypothetical protein